MHGNRGAAATVAGSAAVVVAMLLLSLTAGPAAGATLEAAAAGLAQGVYVQPGSGQDADALRGVVQAYAPQERLIIIVLGSGLAQTPADAADGLLAEVSGDSVVLFTPDDVAMASRVHSGPEIDQAFEDAGSRALDANAAVAAGALMAALYATSTPVWVWLLAAAVVVGVVVIVVRLVRERQQRQTRQRAFQAARARFQARVQTVATRILEAEERLQLVEDPALDAKLLEATTAYQDTLWSLERVATEERLQTLDARIARAEAALDDISDSLG